MRGACHSAATRVTQSCRRRRPARSSRLCRASSPDRRSRSRRPRAGRRGGRAGVARHSRTVRRARRGELVPQRRRDQARRHGIHAHRRQFEREAAGERLERRVDRALQHGRRARPCAKETRHESQRAARRDVDCACDAIRAPELAVHRGLRVVERQRPDRAGGRPGGGDHDVVELAGPRAERVDGRGIGDVQRFAAHRAAG